MIPDSTDVMIAGAGNAAMCAAIAAAEAGANVVVFDAAPREMRGGNTRHTRNLRASHDGPLQTLTGSYDDEEFWEDLLRVTGGNTDENLARLMIRESAGLVDWLHRHGVHFQPALSGTLSLDRTNAFFLGGGKAMLNAEHAAANKLGVKVFYDCEVIDIRHDEGSFTSATVVSGGVQHTIAAKAAVIASGGFQANTEWVTEAWGERAKNFLIRGTPYNRGSLLKALMDRGAMTVSDPTQCHAVAIDARAPKFDGGIVSRIDCVCFSVVVNKNGKRFYDEGEDFWPKRYAIWGRLVAKEPDQIAYAIIDSKVINNFMPSVFPSITADSLEELAGEIEVDADALNETIARFNNSVVQGDYDPGVLDSCYTEDLDPPKSHWALKIDTPPYYAYPLRPGITFTYLSLAVDERTRVKFEEFGYSENIFAAGEVMAGNILGQGYCAGTGMTIGGVFGRIAGKEAACAAKHK